MPTTREKCAAIRKRFYRDDERPGVMHQRLLEQRGGEERVMLEIGCGRDARLLHRLASHYDRLYGIDPELPGCQTTDGRLTLLCGDAHHIPLPDESVDVVTSKDVMEHLRDPAASFRECARVLKPGGRVILLTVNQWHPPIVAARVMPHALRQVVNRFATGTAHEDTFPTYYRANAPGTLARFARAAGLKPVQIRYVSCQPGYLAFSPIVYRMAVAIEQVVRASDHLGFLRQFISAEFAKPGRSLRRGTAPEASRREGVCVSK